MAESVSRVLEDYIVMLRALKTSSDVEALARLAFARTRIDPFLLGAFRPGHYSNEIASVRADLLGQDELTTVERTHKLADSLDGVRQNITPDMMQEKETVPRSLKELLRDE